jgi:integrase
MNFCAPGSVRLSEFLEDSLRKTGTQIGPSTHTEYRSAMEDLIRVVGDMDLRSITLSHGELYRQTILDEGNRPATVAKKIREIRLLFQTAVSRKLLEENPLQGLKVPRVPKTGTIRTYSQDECDRLLKVSVDIQKEQVFQWDLGMTLALITGMRRGEIWNLAWSDIDFDQMTIRVNPKQDTQENWQWVIKDKDSRTLPLTEDVVHVLAALQSQRPTGYPYVMVPPDRCDHIHRLRKQGKWSLEDTKDKIINNFDRQFHRIRRRAGIPSGTFHDLRRTAITNWFYEGLSIIEVMRLAGHSKYETTLRYYLHVKDDLVDRARLAIKHRVSKEMLDRCLGGQNDSPK